MGKKQSFEQVISRAVFIHNNKYNYSITEPVYENMYTKVPVLCLKHGTFMITMGDHIIHKIGCPKCTKGHHRTQNEFIEELKDIYGDIYDYSKVNFINTNTKVTVICPIHGEFSTLAGRLLDKNRGHRGGCPKCSQKVSNKNQRISLEEFIRRANEIHNNKYDYSLVKDDSYKNFASRVSIICPEHGLFTQRITNHLLEGSGCIKCTNARPLDYDTFMVKAREVHGNRYEYPRDKYQSGNNKMTIVCPEHGEFKQRYDSHLYGAGCPKCHVSKGEQMISRFLLENNIPFDYQKTFPDCKSKASLRFDFYIPSQNKLIEFQGMQHYIPVPLWGGEEGLRNIQKRDSLKRDYCIKNNIPLLEVRSEEQKPLELLSAFLNIYHKSSL